MTGFERWDVVTALFPFTDAPVRKPRPVLILSSAAFNRDHGHVVACMITTGARSRWPSDHPLAELGPTGLTHASVVRWKLFTLPVKLIAQRIGCLGESDRAPIGTQLHEILVA